MIKNAALIIRKQILKKIKKIKFNKKVSIGRKSEFEGHNFLDSYVEFIDSSIGYGSYIGKNSHINYTSIGRYSCVGTNVDIIAGNHPTKGFVSLHPAFYSMTNYTGIQYTTCQKFNDYKYADDNGKKLVVIGNDVWIGSFVKILNGVKIGDGCVLAAGAIVTKDIPNYAIAGGVPAKILGYRFEKADIEFLCQLKWWDRGEHWILDHYEKFEDIRLLKEVVEKDGSL